MRKSLMVVLLFTIGLACALLLADEKQPVSPSVNVQGLRIVKQAPDDYGNASCLAWSTGVTLDLLVKSPEGVIIGFDETNSKITAFADDKGKDLTKVDVKNDFSRDGATFGPMTTISENGKYIGVAVCVPALPTKGASVLKITGELKVVVASKKQSFMSEKVALKADTKIGAGAIPLTIKSVGKSKWDAEGMSVTLHANQSLKNVVDIQFYTSEGKKVKASRTTTETENIGDKVAETWSYDLEQKIDSAKIEITYWLDTKSVLVPFSVTAGLGF